MFGENPLYTHHVAVGSGPLSIQSGWHLQTSVLFPVSPAGGTQSAQHVGRPPWVPLIRASGYTQTKHIKLLPTPLCSTQPEIILKLAGFIISFRNKSKSNQCSATLLYSACTGWDIITWLFHVQLFELINHNRLHLHCVTIFSCQVIIKVYFIWALLKLMEN